MDDKTTEFEITLKVTAYGHTQGDAITELERRLRSVPASQDEYAVVLREVTAKRVGAVRVR